MEFHAYGYEGETNAAIADAKIIIDRLLENDEFYHLLAPVDVDRTGIEEVSDMLNAMMEDQHITYEMKTEFSGRFALDHWTQTDAALQAVRDLLNSIEDPEFWCEKEGAVEDIMDVLDDCGINY